jgi:hypothetical protein
MKDLKSLLTAGSASFFLVCIIRDVNFQTLEDRFDDPSIPWKKLIIAFSLLEYLFEEVGSVFLGSG